MMSPHAASRRPARLPRIGIALALMVLLPGCTVVTVGAAAVSVTATVVGVAADAAVGTAKVVGKGVGKAYDAMTEPDAADHSGINVHYRDAAAPASTPAAAATTTAAPYETH